ETISSATNRPNNAQAPVVQEWEEAAPIPLPESNSTDGKAGAESPAISQASGRRKTTAEKETPRSRHGHVLSTKEGATRGPSRYCWRWRSADADLLQRRLQISSWRSRMPVIRWRCWSRSWDIRFLSEPIME